MFACFLQQKFFTTQFLIYQHPNVSLLKAMPLELLHPLVQNYALQYTSPVTDALRQVEIDTVAQHTKAHMLSGPVQGKWLEIMATLLQPQRILEIGTFTGYSTICLANGLPAQGCIHTIELRADDAATAQKNFNTTAQVTKIHLHVGDALSILPTLPGLWDMVFIDADKVNYIAYYKLVMPKLKKGGVIIADNVLFHGEVLTMPIEGKNAKAIQAFNEYVAKDEAVQQVLLTVRDGLLLIIKK
jgi:caffeoyl-CoA O-methyltransferase